MDHLKDSPIMGAWLGLAHSVHVTTPSNILNYCTTANTHYKHKQL